MISRRGRRFWPRKQVVYFPVSSSSISPTIQQVSVRSVGTPAQTTQFLLSSFTSNTTSEVEIITLPAQSLLVYIAPSSTTYYIQLNYTSSATTWSIQPGSFYYISTGVSDTITEFYLIVSSPVDSSVLISLREVKDGASSIATISNSFFTFDFS